ncbi:hypothetical protein GCM10010994_56360 [Chelatococcus reniformis]|uniref:Uncharacterized protein n=1 Tax=Chelatococcus reniformis TaxID=1494448 RepID=A0A916UW35_9HYPH|nr:hypothetical protein [Chelatococcus reniformis]GGC91338.1 hypothetical protein GCM10010994_56360 [Chelatococcus reniformis]
MRPPPLAQSYTTQGDTTFPSHRCLAPASEFRHRREDKRYSFSLADGDWFYLVGI